MIIEADTWRAREALLPEDQARADLYALIARLFYMPADATLLRAVVDAGALVAGDRPLAWAWKALHDAAVVIDTEAAREEYDRLFIGVGKAEVSLYASYYLAGPAKELSLVKLRDEFAARGLMRRESAHEPEDHLSGLADAMRFLVAGDGDAAPASVAEQERFFVTWIQPWYGAFVAAVLAARGENFFYNCAVRLADAFFAVEAESFTIEAL